MVYLIDDKKERQENDYNWTFSKLSNYKEILHPIYSLEELQGNSSKIFKEAKVILYHESFIDKSILSDEAAQKRKELTDYAQRENKYLVYFSGVVILDYWKGILHMYQILYYIKTFMFF